MYAVATRICLIMVLQMSQRDPRAHSDARGAGLRDISFLLSKVFRRIRGSVSVWLWLWLCPAHYVTMCATFESLSSSAPAVPIDPIGIWQGYTAMQIPSRPHYAGHGLLAMCRCDVDAPCVLHADSAVTHVISRSALASWRPMVAFGRKSTAYELADGR